MTEVQDHWHLVAISSHTRATVVTSYSHTEGRTCNSATLELLCILRIVGVLVLAMPCGSGQLTFMFRTISAQVN